MWMSSETALKVESCQRNPMHFGDATKNRSDDVKQWDFKRKRDLDALMSCHQVEGLVNSHRWSSHGQWRRRRNKSLETQFCFWWLLPRNYNQMSRKATDKPRDPGQTCQNCATWSGSRDGCPDGRNGASWKSHDGGTMDLEHRDECDPEHRHECTKVQNCTMNQNKRCSGLLRSNPMWSARVRSRVKHTAGWLHPGCAWILTHDWECREHVTAMKELRGTIRPELIVTQMRVRDAADHEDCLRTSCEIHKKSGAGWLLLLAWTRAPWSKLEQRIDPWHTGEWLVQVKAGRAGHGSAEGLEATGARWHIAEHQRVRVRNDGTRLANVGRNSHYKFFNELTGALLDPEQVRLANIKEVVFLHTFPVYEKVCEPELKGTEFVLTRWILTDERTCQATRHSSTV